MLNPDYIPDNVLTAILEQKGWPDEEYQKVSELSLGEALDCFLRHEGFIGYTEMILAAVRGLEDAEHQGENDE